MLRVKGRRGGHELCSWSDRQRQRQRQRPVTERVDLSEGYLESKGSLGILVTTTFYADFVEVYTLGAAAAAAAAGPTATVESQQTYHRGECYNYVGSSIAYILIRRGNK